MREPQFALPSNNWSTSMSKFQLTLVPTQNVGLAFQQAVDAVTTGDHLTKRKRKAEFNRLKKALMALRQIDGDNFEITHIANGVTLNGEHVIMVGYRSLVDEVMPNA